MKRPRCAPCWSQVSMDRLHSSAACLSERSSTKIGQVSQPMGTVLQAVSSTISSYIVLCRGKTHMGGFTVLEVLSVLTLHEAQGFGDSKDHLIELW